MIHSVHTSLRSCLPFAGAMALFGLVSIASAQDEEPAGGGATESDFSDMDEEGGEVEETNFDEEESDQPGADLETPPPSSPDEPLETAREPDGSTQLLMGLRYRALITPKWLINTFGVDGGRTVLLHGFGPEFGGYFGETADGFMVLVSPWFAGYGLEETPFKGKSDDDSAWEIIESRMKVWYITVDAMWDHKIIDKLSVGAGLGAGLGIVTGKLLRNEAYLTPPGQTPDLSADKDWPDLSYCDGPNNPDGTQCPGDGNYDIVEGGSSDRWPVYPWLNFQTHLRYQPVDEFVGRLDIGLGSSGFWIGLGADYSLFL